MGFAPNNFDDAAGAPRFEVYPSITLGQVVVTVPAGGSSLIKHSASLVDLPVSDDWAIATKSLMTCHLRPVLNATLDILVSYDGAAFNSWKTFPLFAVTDNMISGLFIPGWMCQFKIINSDAGFSNVVGGMIKLQGVS